MPFTFIRNWKRKRILRKPFPPTWEPHLRGLPFFFELNGEEQDKLRGMVQVFLAEKQFEGCGGLTLDNAMRVGIAAQACLLVLHLNHDWYRGVRTILVYPSSFRSSFAETGPGGVVGPPSASAHAGEAWLGGLGRERYWSVDQRPTQTQGGIPKANRRSGRSSSRSSRGRQP